MGTKAEAMSNFSGGLLLIFIAIVCINTGLFFGHEQHTMLALIPIGAFCGVGGGFLLARGGRR